MTKSFDRQWAWPLSAMEALLEAVKYPLPASAIAKVFSEHFGRVVTKNMIIGKLNRLGVRKVSGRGYKGGGQ